MELFDIMMESEVPVENAWELFSMGLKELQDEGLISVNLAIVFKNISLENMLSMGKEELENLPKFWERWIGLLI